MKEIWKDIPSTDGNYQASNLGRIRSNEKVFTKESGNQYKRWTQEYRIPSKILKQSDHGAGYMRVNLSIRGKRKSVFVHRLVAKTFTPNPKNKRCVNHIDCNKANNSIDNLEWVTYQENINHALDNGITGSTLNEKQVLEIRALYPQGWVTQKEIANAYSINIKTVSNIINENTWKHV